MSQLYVPEGVFLVCTDGMKKQELLVSSQSTIKIAKGRLVATENDRMKGNHNCAKMVIAGAIVGAIVAAIICAAVVLSGGTLAIGLGAALAIGAASGAGLGAAIGAFVPCFCAMLTSRWGPVHPMVKYESQKALLEYSMIPCKLGGMIQIVYSEEKANALTTYKIAETLATTGAIIFLSFTAGATLQGLWAAGSSIAATYTTFGTNAMLFQLLGIGTGAGMNYGLGQAYDSIKKNEYLREYLGGYTIDEHINGTADGLENSDHNKIYGTANSPVIGVLGGAGDGAKETTKSQTDSYYILEQQSVQLQNTGNTIAVAPDGTAYPTNSVIVSNPTQTTILSNAGSNSSIAGNETRVVDQSLSTSADGNRATANRTMETTGMQYRNEFGSMLKSNFTNSLKGLLKDICKDLIALIANKVLGGFLKDIEEAESAEIAEKAKITVIEHEV